MKVAVKTAHSSRACVNAINFCLLMRSFLFRMSTLGVCLLVFFFQAEDGIRDLIVTGVQTCALPIYLRWDGLPPRGEEPVVERLPGGGEALPRLLDEAQVYPVPYEPRHEGPLLVLRVPLEEKRLDVELAGLVEGVQEVAG